MGSSAGRSSAGFEVPQMCRTQQGRVGVGSWEEASSSKQLGNWIGPGSRGQFNYSKVWVQYCAHLPCEFIFLWRDCLQAYPMLELRESLRVGVTGRKPRETMMESIAFCIRHGPPTPASSPPASRIAESLSQAKL